MSNPPNRDQRIDAAIPVRFSDAREFLVEYSSNISLGGVFVRTSSPAPFGTVVRLSLELPGTGQAVPVTGQVAFVLPADQAARQGKVPGMGVRFARLDSAVQETLAAYVSSLQKSSKGRVLLVDDDAVQLQQLADMLRGHNLNVTTVSSAVKALEIVRFGGIDFILSDINMPRMDGFEFRDNLRSNPKTSSIPFVFLTASVDEGDRQVAGELGVKHFLTKPVQPDHLLALLREILGDGAFAPGNEEQNAGTAAPEAKTAKQKQAQRRIVEIAYRKFVALGLDTRFTADERGVFGQLQLKSVNIQDPVTGQRLDRAGFYSVGHDRAKPFWPRALGALPMIAILDLPNGQALEQQIAVSFQRKLDEVRKVKQFLDKFAIPNRYEPITLRVLGQIKIGADAVVFSVRDPKTLFLESLNGQSFGAVAAMRARLVDITDAKSGVDVEIELETVCKRLKEDLARATPSGPATSRSISASGATFESRGQLDLAGPDDSMSSAPEQRPASPASRPAAPAAPPSPPPIAGSWIGESEDEFPLAAGSLPSPATAAPPATTADAEEIWPEEAGLTLGPATEVGHAPLDDAPEPSPEAESPAEPAWSPAVETFQPVEPARATGDAWSETSLTEPNAEPAAEPYAESVAEPYAEPVAEPYAESAAEPIAAPYAEPAVEEAWSASAPAESEAVPTSSETAWSEPAAPVEGEPPLATAESAWSEPAADAADIWPENPEQAPESAAFAASPDQTEFAPAGETMWSAESEEPGAGVMPSSIDLGPETTAVPMTAEDMNDAGIGTVDLPEAAEAPELDLAAAPESARDEWVTESVTESVPESVPEPVPESVPELEPSAPPVAAPPVVAAKSRYGFFAGAATPPAPAPAPAPKPAPVSAPASELPPEDVEARQWADEWVADESSATPLWSMQPADATAEMTPHDVPSALASSAAAATGAAPGSDAGTPMVCTTCGETYMLGEDIADERLLLQCPSCIAAQG